jgi:hypothetical protein
MSVQRAVAAIEAGDMEALSRVPSSDVSDALRAMMPGAVDPPSMTPDEALLLAMRMGALKRAVKYPGSGDAALIRDLCRIKPHMLTPAQRALIVRLCWRYRFQLPSDIRPAADPDMQSTKALQ